MSKSLKSVPEFMGVFYHIAGQHSPIKTRPEIASAIAEVMAAWGGLEMAMHSTYSALLGVRQRLASEIFASLQSEGPKAAAIRAMAKYRLKQNQRDMFFAALDLVDGVRRERDKIAHSVYGSIKLYPQAGSNTARDLIDHLALANLKDVIRNNFTRKATAYSVADINGIARKINKSAYILSGFSSALHLTGDEQASQFRKLLEEPYLREALIRRRNKAQRIT